MVEVEELRKSFGDFEAVRGVSFEVEPGEVFGFLGPNGAGKTTTINMLCTLAKPTSGRAFVAGHDVVRERDDVAAQHRPGLPGSDARRLPHGCAEPAPACRAVWRRLVTRAQPHGADAADGWPVGPSRRDRDDVLGRHAPPAGDRAWPHALAARPLPRRA